MNFGQLLDASNENESVDLYPALAHRYVELHFSSKQNITKTQSGLPSHSLPGIFHEAVIVSQPLHFQYLSIDNPRIG